MALYKLINASGLLASMISYVLHAHHTCNGGQ